MTSLSRRSFAQLLALSGSAALFPRTVWARESVESLGLTSAPLPQAPSAIDETYWRQVRARFLVPKDLNFLNAANLCPTSLVAVEAHEKAMRAYEAGPTPEARNELFTKGKEDSRKLLADALRVSPEEIVITRNAPRFNLVSSGRISSRRRRRAGGQPSNPRVRRQSAALWLHRRRRHWYRRIPGRRLRDLFRSVYRHEARRDHTRQQQLGRWLPARVCAARPRRPSSGRWRAVVRRSDRSAAMNRISFRARCTVAVRAEGEGPALRGAVHERIQTVVVGGGRSACVTSRPSASRTQAPRHRGAGSFRVN